MIRIGAAALALVLSGCTIEPSAPPRHRLSGSVRLVGRLFLVDGTPVGVRTVTDADSVPVYLSGDVRNVDSTLTTDGAFAFAVLNGNYLAHAEVVPGVGDTTAQLRVHGEGNEFPDPLRLVGTGAVTPRPNPFPSAIELTYRLAADGEVRLEVWRLRGGLAKRLFLGTQVAGLHAVTWDGRDEDGSAVPPGSYWVVLERDGVQDVELIFREP